MLVVFAVTMGVFLPSLGNDFVDLDDDYFRGGDVLVYFWLAADALGGLSLSGLGPLFETPVRGGPAISGELHAYLIDGGSASFYVDVATYLLESFEALQDNSGTAGDRARSTLEEFTYDALNTGAGVTAAQDDLLTALDELVMELNYHGDPTIVAVTLHITYLDPEPMWMGEAPGPSYP